VPNTKSKCNSPTIAQGSVAVGVVPTLAKSDGTDTVTPGVATTYAITITNTTGFEVSTANGNAAVFRDSTVANLTAVSINCAASGGAAATWSYVPSGIYDPAVTNLRFTPSGRISGSAGAGDPYFELRYRVRVK
jgi:hypothetical protein